ncbi:NAD(P)/FAD-dependent oxidoreductase [Haloprofundus salilacus]|uniref:NAD(P)/FAD-dependent oxidoreductase n=1 Tax=Haloprofundus salilacus TaxID=2876190 RepID=UPI001CCA4D13|nr:FAD-binding oxidoreductase [Haloprofundus salilacus]
MTGDRTAVRGTTRGDRRDAGVLVVGGGVVGCAVARELAADHDVVVLEQDQIAGGATALAAGEITMTPSYSDVLAVADHANDFFRGYDGTGRFRFHERPSLELVRDGRADAARRRVDRLRSDGIDVAYLEPEAVRERYPRVDASRLDGAVRHAETGFVDPYTFAVTLKEEAEARGARFRMGLAVDEVVVDDGRIRGVSTAEGEFCAPTVVAAAGWRTERLLRDVVRIPVRPYRTQCIVLDPGAPLEETFPMGWIPGEHVYFRAEHNGDLLVGGWSFATDDPEGASRQEDEAFRDHVAEVVPSVFREFDRAGFVDGWAGIDGATPDTRPIIDAPADAPEGLIVATGFHGRGIMTAPVAATLVRSFVTGEACDLPREEFTLSRFDSTSPDFEFRSISAGDDSYE